jgi:hypothetical protein
MELIQGVFNLEIATSFIGIVLDSMTNAINQVDQSDFKNLSDDFEQNVNTIQKELCQVL